MFWVQLQGLLCHKPVYGTSFKREEDGSRTEFLIIFLPSLIQTVRNSISIELPSNWYNSKWIGLALWALVSHIRSMYGSRQLEVAVGKCLKNIVPLNFLLPG